MSPNPSKLSFLQNEFPALLKKLTSNEKPVWGLMNPQQMIEHMSDSFQRVNGKKNFPITTPADQLPAYHKFLMSDKEFRPGTKNPLLGETPVPVHNKSIADAIAELEKETVDFIFLFEDNPDKKVTDPIFGQLNFEECVQLLHKHAMHHAKQFGLL